MFPRLVFIGAPGRLSAADHRRRLEQSPLYQRREREAAIALQRGRLQALLYLNPNYYERFPGEMGTARR